MISSIGQNNNIQRFSAVNALKTSANMLKPKENEDKLLQSEEVSSGIKVAPKSILDRVDIADIRKNASYVGEFNISEDEIKYGLMYGRSVIAEFLC